MVIDVMRVILRGQQMLNEFYGNPGDWFRQDQNRYMEGKWLAKKKS